MLLVLLLCFYRGSYGAILGDLAEEIVSRFSGERP